MIHSGEPEPHVRSHVVAKHNKRLVVRCVETSEVVYTPPDFLRPLIRNRDGLQTLANRLTLEWARPIRAIMDFESSVRPTQ